MRKEIARGAEAVIFLEDNKIIKNRIKKNYRIDELDRKLRINRTKREINLLKKSSEIINVPKLLSFTDTEIITEYINGNKLSDVFDNIDEREKICFKIGEYLAKLHNKDIIHGDLTTSNIMINKNYIYFIDFGLGFISNKIEDKAVDLHLLKQALKSRHFYHYEKAFLNVLNGYKKFSNNFTQIEERLKSVETRGRYKRKNK